MKRFTILLFTILIGKAALAQDDYQKFIQAALQGDTVLAEQILKNSVKTDSVQEKVFAIKNVTEHIFKINITALKDSIINFFEINNDPEKSKFLNNIFYRNDCYDDDTARRMILFSVETINDPIFSKDYFAQHGTSNDVFLTVYHEAWESKFYYSKGHALNYTTDFVLKLSKVGKNLTNVKVVALNPEVINGKGLGVHGSMYEYA